MNKVEWYGQKKENGSMVGTDLGSTAHHAGMHLSTYKIF